MGWLNRTFLYRDDYNPAFLGLRGLALLWFFHLSFYLQFDLSKLTRLTESKPWLARAVDGLVLSLVPALFTPEVFYVLGGFLVAHAVKSRTFPGFTARRLLRFYPVFIVAVLPTLAYTGPDWSRLAWTATFFTVPQDIPVGNSIILARAFWLPLLLGCLTFLPRIGRGRDTLPALVFLAVGTLDFVLFMDLKSSLAFAAVLSGWVMARHVAGLPGSLARQLAGPCLLMAVVLVVAVSNGNQDRNTYLSLAVIVLTSLALAALTANPRSLCGRVLSSPFFRYYGAVALPFYLIHTTWGFRLSRSLLQGELHSVSDIAAHYVLSFAFSTVFAGLLHVFFERRSFLRNAPAADKTPGSAIQGVSP